MQRADSGLPTQQLDLSGFTVNSSTTMTLAADEATLTLVPWIGRAVGGAFGAVLQNSQGELAEVTYAEVVVMTDVVSTRCTLSKHALSTYGDAFPMYNGTAYMHSPRLPTFDNTPEQLASLDSSSIITPTVKSDVEGEHSTTFSVPAEGMSSGCMNVQKNVLNAHSCRPSSACSPTGKVAERCASPGEVGNVPSLGNIFIQFQDGQTIGNNDAGNENSYAATTFYSHSIWHRTGPGYVREIHFELAMYADDQLCGSEPHMRSCKYLSFRLRPTQGI